MTITKNQLKPIWVAKSQLGVNDEEFRTALVQIKDMTSAKELDRDGLNAMMGFFQFCGFAPLRTEGPSYGTRSGMASFVRIELIRLLWQEYTQGKAGEAALNLWLERYWKLSNLRCLSAATAPRIITALKAMKARAA